MYQNQPPSQTPTTIPVGFYPQPPLTTTPQEQQTPPLEYQNQPIAAPPLPPNPFADPSTPDSANSYPSSNTPATDYTTDATPRAVNPSKFDAFLESYIDGAERYLTRGPSSHKSTLKRSIWQLSLEVYELSILCQKKIATKTTLNALNAKHELLRRLWARLYKCGGLDYNTRRGKLSNPDKGLRRYRFINTKLDNVGVAVGTWYKQLIRKCNH